MSSFRRAQSESANIAVVEYSVLGPLRVVRDGEALKLGGRRQRMVLAVLLARCNRVVSRDALIEAVWAGHPPDSARTTLHSYLSNLRGQLGESLVRSGDGYRVDATVENFDALRFEGLVDAARDLIGPEPGSALPVTTGRARVVGRRSLWRPQRRTGPSGGDRNAG